MKVENLYMVLPSIQKVIITFGTDRLYEGLAKNIPEMLLDYKVTALFDFEDEECIYIATIN